MTNEASGPASQATMPATSSGRPWRWRTSCRPDWSDGLSARDFDPLGGHPAVIVAQQAGDHRPNILRNAHPSQRRHRGKLRVNTRVVPHQPAAKISGDSPGGDGIDGDEQSVFGAESNGTVQAWRRADGERLWSVDKLQYRKLTAPLVLGRSVVLADDLGTVHMLSREDGSALTRLQTDKAGVATAPVVAANTLVVVSRSGTVYGFKPD